MRLDTGTIEELIDLFLKISKNITVPEGTVILVGSVSLLARVGVHGYSSACINAKRRLTGAIKGVVVIPFIPPPLGGCNDTEVIRSVIDTSIWLGSIPGYALSETSKGLVDMVMDDIAAEVGGGGLPTMTDRSFFRSHLRVMTVNMSPVLVGQAFRPLCPPGLKPTKKNIWICSSRN
jgi:hypothetical protein